MGEEDEAIYLGKNKEGKDMYKIRDGKYAGDIVITNTISELLEEIVIK